MYCRPKQSYRVFNTWMGDPSKVILLEAITQIIKKENLLDRVTRVGNYMLKSLMDIEKEHSNIVNSVRGRGTFIAFNCISPEMRDTVIKKLLARGKRLKTLNIKNIFTSYYLLHFCRYPSRWMWKSSCTFETCIDLHRTACWYIFGCTSLYTKRINIFIVIPDVFRNQMSSIAE
jgi:hypothetical protein